MKLISSIRKGWAGLLPLVLVLTAALPSMAQNPPSARLELKNLEKLSSKASEVTDVTLDGDLLQMAAKFLEHSDDPDTAEIKSIIKGLTGIYVKSFEFDAPNQYSQADVEAIRAQLAAPGWTRIVESRSRHDAETDEIYLMKVKDKIVGVAILVAEPKELTVVNIVGPLDMDQLSRLAGKFGVPEQVKNHRKNKPVEGSHEKK